jgi:hypothetical protein
MRLSECHGLTQTAGPFFVFFIPVFYWFQGWPASSGPVAIPGIYCVAITAFCEHLSRAYRLAADFTCARRGYQVVFAAVPEPGERTLWPPSSGLGRASCGHYRRCVSSPLYAHSV